VKFEVTVTANVKSFSSGVMPCIVIYFKVLCTLSDKFAGFYMENFVFRFILKIVKRRHVF